MSPPPDPGDIRTAAIIFPARHLLEGAGAARVFERQARELRQGGWRVLAIAVAPSASWRHKEDKFAPSAAIALERLADSHFVIGASKISQRPNMLMHAVAARLRKRWSLGADRAVSDYIDPSALRTRRADVVVCNYIQGLSAADALAAPQRQVLVLHDLDPGPAPGWLIRLARERGAVAALNAEEANRLNAAGVNCVVLPPVFAPAPEPAMHDDRAKYDLLFVGGPHPPNVEGLRAFVSGCFAPHLARRGLRMAVAGDAGPLAIKGENTLGITPLGRVEDLVSCYRAARLVVCPLLSGTGSSIKLGEALAAGKAVLATPVAWRGYDVDASATLTAPFDERWARRILDLLDDRASRESLFRAGARAIERSSANPSLLQIVERVVRQ
jgi:hypothetical protein